MKSPVPDKEIPAPLMGNEYGTWTHYSIVERLPDIARRVILENDLTLDNQARIEELIDEIPDGKIRLLNPGNWVYLCEWNKYITPYVSMDWLQVPWFFAEFYFYHRILEAICYFRQDGMSSPDPFIYQKRQGLFTSQEKIRELCDYCESSATSTQSIEEILSNIIEISAWGNQSDLSVWPTNDEGNQQHQHNPDHNQLIINQAGEITKYLLEDTDHHNRIDIITDNAGFEFVCDLVLIDYLLHNRIVGRLTLHLKYCPIYVSDALVADFHDTVSTMQNDGYSTVQDLGNRLRSYFENRRLVLSDDPIWTSPLAFWEFPGYIMEDLAQSSLLLFKGDVNYRRLLGDRHWDYTTPFAEIAVASASPIAASRILKSDVISGLKPGQEQELNRKDVHWLTDGEWGIIQFRR